MNVIYIIEEDVYAKFYKYKYLVFNSWQYLYLTQAINSENVADKYNELLQNRDLKQEQEFDERYLKTRKWLLKNRQRSLSLLLWLCI